MTRASLPKVAQLLLAIALTSCTVVEREEAAELRWVLPPAPYTSCVAAPESLLVVNAAAVGETDLGYPRETVDQLAIRGLAADRSFGALDTLLGAYADSVWLDHRLEYRLLDAYDAFDVADQTLEPLLDEYVASYPESPAARLARATYYIESAARARGARWAGETSREQFARMDQYLAKARVDIAEAERLTPCAFIAYYLSMRVTQPYGAADSSRAYLNRALAVYPLSFLLRSMHMYNLVPRWGGSYEEMTQFATESDALRARNPRLNVLHGFAAWDRGRVYWSRSDTASAMLEHAKALVFGDLWQFRLELGKLKYRTRRYEEALSHLDRAVAQRPVSVETLRFRAMTQYALGRVATGAERERFHRGAFRDIELAARLDPLDERVRRSRAFYYERISEFAPRMQP